MSYSDFKPYLSMDTPQKKEKMRLKGCNGQQFTVMQCKSGRHRFQKVPQRFMMRRQIHGNMGCI